MHSLLQYTIRRGGFVEGSATHTTADNKRGDLPAGTKYSYRDAQEVQETDCTPCTVDTAEIIIVRHRFQVSCGKTHVSDLLNNVTLM